MSDDFDPLRHLRPDAVLPDDTGDPGVLARHKAHLMSVIGDDDAVAPNIPAVYPRLAYIDEVAALEYLTRVFGFREWREARKGTGAPDDGMLAWLEFGGGLLMISRAEHGVHRIYSPREVGQATTMINVTVHDIDRHYARAVAEGAEITMDLGDAFYGDRRYEASDPEGHRWHFSESFAAIRARGGHVPDES